jgi:4a-hydroxytetrahydrobiopterin dehydratase
MRTHHLHLTEFDGPYWRRIVGFRDWLRSHPVDAHRYAELKRELVIRHERDSHGYTDAKHAFVAEIEQRAGIGAGGYRAAMTERISAQQFEESAGVEDWRVVWGGQWACAHFRTGSFAAGAALVGAIADLATVADHPPDVDLRPEGVAVRLTSADVQGVTEQDVELARQISAAAGRLGLPADPTVVQHVQVAIDALAIPEVLPFWRAVLGYQAVEDDDLVDPARRGPSFWFQQMDGPRPGRGRIHLDVYVPRDQVQGRLAAALAAGGRVISDAHAPKWWTLADVEGNEVDLASWG